MEKLNKSKIEVVPIDQLIEADWNYKVFGEDEDIKKLGRSIKARGSAGVLAVREVELEGNIKLEVCDGNHRFRALKDEVGVKKLVVENFGNISLDEAILIARSRNHQWFDDDKIQLAKLMTEEVLTKYDIDSLADMLPDSKADLEGFMNMATFDWSEPTENDLPPRDSNDTSSEQTKKLELYVPEEVYNIWHKWLDRCKNITGIESKERAFEFAVIEALNIPDEVLERIDD